MNSGYVSTLMLKEGVVGLRHIDCASGTIQVGGRCDLRRFSKVYWQSGRDIWARVQAQSDEFLVSFAQDSDLTDGLVSLVYNDRNKVHNVRLDNPSPRLFMSAFDPKNKLHLRVRGR